MKTTAFIFLMLLLPKQILALQIRQLALSPISSKAINLSLDTEAVELYYFQSWEYSVSGNTITLKAFYVEGFGSTIAYLNNNFEIPFNNNQSETFQLIVKIYYTDENLQDESKVTFFTPLTALIYLSNDILEISKVVVYPNPTKGLLEISQNIEAMIIYNCRMEKVKEFRNVKHIVDISNLPDGIYLARLNNGGASVIKKIVLRK